MCELFQKTEHPCNLQNNPTFRKNNAKTVQNGADILLFMGPKIWSVFSSNINNSETLEIFKQKISFLQPANPHAGFLKPLLKAFDIYKAIAFLSGFVLKKPLPQIIKCFFLSVFSLIFHCN